MLYADIDLELSWSEAQLPQVERTKHVHALHPSLGKFIPQLVEAFLSRYFVAGECLYDPFCGSGTALVEANAYGCDAVGCDISAFNCLLSSVKTRRYDHALLAAELDGVLEQALASPAPRLEDATPWLRRWYARRALGELLAYRDAARELSPSGGDVARIVLSRAARSSRLTTHFDLDFPKAPVCEPYVCHKHKRVCRPVGEAAKFLRRYTRDTLRRLQAFADAQTGCPVQVLHADSRGAELPVRPSGVVTSPPYPGLIDYHEQHRYAYELLGLTDRRELEIGPATAGRGRAALAAYVGSMASVFLRVREALPADAPVVIVVNDTHELYPSVLEGAGLRLDDRLRRHVNRRTGRRLGEFYEDVLICRA